MDIVISKEQTQGHIINKYKFKVLSTGAPGEPPKASEPSETPFGSAPSEPAPDTPAVPETSRDELVESLLKKTDEMTTNFIKMQMKLEEQEAQHKSALEAAKTEAFEAGVQEGMARCERERDQAKSEGVEQFAASVRTLEESARSFETALEGIQKELLFAALDIAKQVVGADVSHDSAAIAERLSRELISELQEASKVTLRVNPADHGPLSERIGAMAHVEIVSDRAVSPGGVIAISDAGNMDAELMKRYERIKKAALSG